MLNAPRLTKITYVGKSEAIKWKCRAPLKNGKLCPRMDRFKCPLHGRIVARDEMGEIVNESDRIEFEKMQKSKQPEVAPWQDAELIADINAATGSNIQVLDKNGKSKEKRKRKSGGNLTDVAKEDNTTRKRLERRLLDPKNLNKIGSILDSIERRTYHERFHHNYNYALQS